MKKTLTTLAAPGGAASDTPTSASTLVAPGNLQDALMGNQLTEQYRKAVGAMREFLIFGAMMLQAREMVTVPTRGDGGKFGNKGTGFAAWLEEHAPEIPRGSAYRFMALAEGLQRHFELSAKTDVVLLLTAPPEELKKSDLKARNEIDKFIEGKSQRQLLFDFGLANPKPVGGYRATRADGSPRMEKRTDAEIARDLLEAEGRHYCSQALDWIEKVLLLKGPNEERAWDLLDPARLESLKLAVHDLHQGCVASQNRRKRLTGGK